MKKSTVSVGVLVIAMGLAGCGSEGTASVMPLLKGKKLDIARSAIQSAGINDEVKVDGGGLLGVLEDSNWTVCEQTPAAGTVVSDAPKLKIKRSCPADSTATARPKPAAPAPEPEPVPEVAEPDTTEPTEPAAGQVLTPENNEDLATLLTAEDSCDPEVGPLASKLAGKTIRFDGSIVNVAPHGDYKTRYDFLISPGDKGPASTVGPSFQFEDVNRFDLNFVGKDVEGVSEGDLFRFKATMGEYGGINSCLIRLEPVATRAR